MTAAETATPTPTPASPPTPAPPPGACADILAVVAEARQVPSAEREALAAALKRRGAGDGAVLLHTCHRVELYATGSGLTAGDLPGLPSGTRWLADADAVRHLISVACGLDSAVLGEDQILHQVRQAYVSRRAVHPLDPRLDRLFQVALRAGRRARGWVGGTRRSLSDVAVDEIEERRGPLRGLPVLVVGAGTMGRLAALAAARRGAQVLVTNRSSQRAVPLARQVGGSAVPWPALGLPPVAGAIVAVSGRWDLDHGDAVRLRAADSVVVDLSAPPALDGSAREVLGDRFLSIDDLAWAATDMSADEHLSRVEALVSEAGHDYSRWLASRDVRPLILQLGRSAESRRCHEVEWLMRRLPGLSDTERALVEQMSRRLVAGILHPPRAALGHDCDGELRSAARRLFGL